MAFLIVCASLLAGCVQAEIAIDVNEDGSGTASVLLAFDRSLLELLGSLDESDSTTTEEFDGQSMVDDIDRSQLPAGTTVEPYEQGGFVGARVTSPFEHVEELPALLDRMGGAISLRRRPDHDRGRRQRLRALRD